MVGKVSQSFAAMTVALLLTGCDLPSSHPCIGKWQAEDRDFWLDVRDVNEVYTESSVLYPEKVETAKPTEKIVRLLHEGHIVEFGCVKKRAILFTPSGEKHYFKKIP